MKFLSLHGAHAGTQPLENGEKRWGASEIGMYLLGVLNDGGVPTLWGSL